jgi:hypothetical protein
VSRITPRPISLAIGAYGTFDGVGRLGVGGRQNSQGVSDICTKKSFSAGAAWRAERGRMRRRHCRSSRYSAALRASGPSACSTRGLTSLIISSIERIAALCGVAPTLNEKHTWTGWVARISPTSFSTTVSTSPISRSSRICSSGGFVGERLIDQHRTLHDLLLPPQARGHDRRHSPPAPPRPRR